MARILIDANILDYGAKSHNAESVATLFEQLKKEALEPVVSAYTTFEVYRGLNTANIPSMKNLVDSLEPLEVDLSCFKLSAVLATCYRNHLATKAYADRYSDGDLVLAGSAFRYKLPILTANANDFPRPFFDEVGKTSITVGKNKAVVAISYLKPNIDCLNEAIASHYGAGGSPSKP